MRVVALEATAYFKFSTRRFSTGASYTLAGTPAIHVYEENNTTQITAATTLTADYDSITGLNDVAVACTAANGFEAGKHYYLTIGAGTIDSVSVVGQVVGEFRIETAAELASRRLQESYTNHLVGATGNTTSAIHLGDLDASIGDDELNGELILWYDVDVTEWHLLGVTDYTASSKVATVVLAATRSTLPNTPASGDYYFRVGRDPFWGTARALMDQALTEDYAADGAAGTVAELLYMIQAVLTEFSVSSTTMTAKKLDGSTTAGTFTLNDATTPTSITRAS